jgi:hypothetical protein
MKDAATTRRPVASFAIPPCVPSAVAKAYETFNRVADEWAETSGAIDDAREAQKAAVAAAQRSVIDAAKTGKSPDADPVAVANEHEAVIVDLVARKAALSVAVDETGNELARVIGQNKDEWVEALETHREETAARYDRAIADARAALTDLTPLRRAVEWVEGFEYGLAIHGQVGQFAGGHIRVRDSEFVRGPSAEPQDPNKLLDILATATAPTETPQPRRHLSAASSSMR